MAKIGYVTKGRTQSANVSVDEFKKSPNEKQRDISKIKPGLKQISGQAPINNMKPTPVSITPMDREKNVKREEKIRKKRMYTNDAIYSQAMSMAKGKK